MFVIVRYYQLELNQINSRRDNLQQGQYQSLEQKEVQWVES